VLHPSAPPLPLPQYPWQHTIHEINVGVYRTSCGSRRQYKYRFDSYVLFSAKSMLEVWATYRRWYSITSLWTLPCCEVLLLCVPNRGLGFTQAGLQERWRRT
jgi:hypothetical protein